MVSPTCTRPGRVRPAGGDQAAEGPRRRRSPAVRPRALGDGDGRRASPHREPIHFGLHGHDRPTVRGHGVPRRRIARAARQASGADAPRRRNGRCGEHRRRARRKPSGRDHPQRRQAGQRVAHRQRHTEVGRLRNRVDTRRFDHHRPSPTHPPTAHPRPSTPTHRATPATSAPICTRWPPRSTTC